MAGLRGVITDPLLSVVMPVYNERDTIAEYSPEEYPQLIELICQGRTDVLRSMTLQSNGFGIEPELTAKIFKRRYRVYEVPITYDGRGYDEGKKITWRDGVVALWVLVRYRFSE